MKTFTQLNEEMTNDFNAIVADMDLVDQLRTSVATTQAILDGLSHCKGDMNKEDYKSAIARATRVGCIMGLITPVQMNALIEALECPTFDSHWETMKGHIAESGVSLYDDTLESKKLLKEALLSL